MTLTILTDKKKRSKLMIESQETQQFLMYSYVCFKDLSYELKREIIWKYMKVKHLKLNFSIVEGKLVKNFFRNTVLPV